MNKKTNLKMLYIVNARFPTPKAYGIQLAKMCEAFTELGVDVSLVVPKTKSSQEHSSVKEFYNLRTEIPIVQTVGFDKYGDGRIFFFISSIVFMISSFIYILSQRIRGSIDIIYTVDMDTFSFTFLPIFGIPIIAEMHDIKSLNLFTRFFFNHSKIVAVNSVLSSDLSTKFKIKSENIIAEQNGVDESWFNRTISKQEARKKLNLPIDKDIVLYVGRFYDWKGIGSLARACEFIPDIDCRIIGGTKEEFITISGIKNISSNMLFMGECENIKIPIWLSAADALVILGTKSNTSTYLYRSPMKTYEYASMRRPIVASSAPALSAIVDENEVFFYKPDDSEDMADKIRMAIDGGKSVEEKVENAYIRAKKHTLHERARRILNLLDIK